MGIEREREGRSRRGGIERAISGHESLMAVTRALAEMTNISAGVHEPQTLK